MFHGAVASDQPQVPMVTLPLPHDGNGFVLISFLLVVVVVVVVGE